jgi:16S rRNA (guanine(966)-N(2))-methyltransferase RsmD
MKIISGRLKGRVIRPPSNLRARPTTDFAKESIFNVLANTVDFETIDVLDLFAGTGSVSYEFASRGARSVTSVEINAVHYDFIRKCAASFGLDNLHPVKANAFLYLRSVSKRYDVIFSDAPYDLKGSEEVIELVFARGLLVEGGRLVFEHSAGTDFSAHPNFLEHRSYGSVNFSIFAAGPAVETE